MKWINDNYKGILLTLLIALVALFLGRVVPIIGGAVFGILLGIIFGDTIGRPAGTAAGIHFTSKKVLQWAIIALGGGLSLRQVYSTRITSLYVMLFTIVAAFSAAFLLGKLLRIPFKLTTLIGMGTAICGGSAIAAISPIIEAEGQDISYTISTVFMFNVIAVVIFPLLGRVAGLTQHGFGMWAGTAINDTSSVVAAAYSYGNEAGAFATIVKLTRTTMIVPISLLIAAVMAVKKEKEAQKRQVHYRFGKIFPWFILWFLGASLLNTFGVISAKAGHFFTGCGKFMIVLALTAIRLHSDFRKMVATGFKPMLMGFLVWAVVAVVSLVVQNFSGLL